MPLGFTRWKSSDPAFDSVLKAWSLSPDLHVFQPPALRQVLEIVQRKLGRPLPPSLVELYGFSNGLRLLEGNLVIDPVSATGSKQGLDTHSDFLRKFEWQVPPELVVFGRTAGQDAVGIWIPKKPKGESPIVLIGEIFQTPRCMAVVGSGFVPFLRFLTARYLLEGTGNPAHPALDALGMPREIRRPEPDGGDLRLLRLWADPGLPDPNPDPYERGVDAAYLREKYGSD